MVPEKLPQVASFKKALEPLETAPGAAKPAKVDPKMAETGLLKRTNAAGDRRYWIYVGKEYNPQVVHAVVVWLHLPGQFKDEDTEKVADRWDEFCNENHIIVVGPITDQDGGWTPSDTDLVLEAVRDVTLELTRELDLTSLLSLITRRSAELVNAPMGVAFLWDDVAGVPVVVRSVHDRDPASREREPEGLHVSFKRSPSSLQPTSRRLDPWPRSLATRFDAGTARTSMRAPVARPAGPTVMGSVR